MSRARTLGHAVLFTHANIEPASISSNLSNYVPLCNASLPEGGAVRTGTPHTYFRSVTNAMIRC